MELEADELGAEYLNRVGYEPEAMIDVVRLLKNQEMLEVQMARQENRQPRVYHGVFSSHPDNDTRLKEVVRAAKKVHERPTTVPTTATRTWPTSTGCRWAAAARRASCAARVSITATWA